jgi:hypothetical protein
MSRALDLDGREPLDPRSIVDGCEDEQPAAISPHVKQEPIIVWQGEVTGDGTGPQRSYYVRLYTDGAGHCACPDYYFRGVLRRDTRFRCKHLVRAWATHGSGGSSTQGK